MGVNRDQRQGADLRPLVAFDFDGTLSFRDSFMAFLAWRAGALGYLLGLLRLAPAALAYLIHRDRERLKARAVAVFLRGMTRDELETACDDFADSTLGRKLIRPDAEQCWRAWRAKDALMLVVTASPEEVVAPFARRLGADVLIGTRLSFDASRRVEGGFLGRNCRGAEKVVRLRERYGPQVRLAAAYGDSSGDKEMLEIAEVQGYRVFKGRA